MVERRAAPIVTTRLVLQPVTRQLARAVVTERLADFPVGAGWPHADTADAMAMALTSDAGPSWIVTVDGVVIGDCGAFSWPDGRGVVEIGYGLAEPFRGQGYATEAVDGMCRWLFGQGGAAVITATGVAADNLASRRVLEKLGFAPIDEDDLRMSYHLQHRVPTESDGQTRST